MTEKTNWLRKQLTIIFASGLFYFAMSVPFIDFLRLSETTEVRPYCVLPFLLSLVYGFPGALGTAIGNIFSDMYYGGMDYKIYILGFSFQLIYGYGGAMLWKYLRRRDKNLFRMDTVKKLSQYLILVLGDSLLISVMVWWTLNRFYNLPFYGIGFVSTFLNHIIYFVLLGIPFLIGYSAHIQKKELRRQNRLHTYIFSINEKFILFLVLLASITGVIIGFFAFVFFRAYDIYDSTLLWGYVFLISGSAIYICLWPGLLLLHFVEKYVASPLERMARIGNNFGLKENIQDEVSDIKSVVGRYCDYPSETGALARSFNTFADKIDEYVVRLTNVSKDRERVSTQLKIARDIQQGVLPAHVDFPEIDLYADMKPALEVAGDFYDYFKIDEHRFGFVIADVSGKGIPSSLFMMASKIIIKKNMLSNMSPGQALTLSNRELCRNNRAEMFVTVFCGILDFDTGLLKYASAGHDHPILASAGREFRMMQNKTGFVLGAMEEISYRDDELVLEKGDTFFIYTDGIPEATDSTKEQFGFDRTIDVLNRNRDRSVSEMCEALLASIDEFKGEADRFDDITVMAFRRK